ncbi:MAG: hypothetical protein F7C35_00680 [Desulfurococcales archaeon]|nr:hypothetical protein [Desulfurococcales archaeon]
MFEEKARRVGFKVYRKEVVYEALTGESVREERLVGYNEEINAKVSYSKMEGEESGRLYITVSGSRATGSMAEKAQNLGGKVDLEEGKRLFAVFKGVSPDEAGELVEKMFRGSRRP